MSGALLTLPRSLGGRLEVVIATHPAGDRCEIELSRFGATLTIPVEGTELDALIGALTTARARILGPARPRLKCGHLAPYGSRGPRC